LLAYDGPARELVARLKYRNARSSLDWLATGLAELVWAADQPTAVTWAPTTSARRRQRGFDQAELLARRLARRLALPCPRLLQRLPGQPQTGRSLADRRVGPVFAPVGRRAPVGAVLLVDDVVTTGATLAAASTALGRAGIGPVIGLAAAFTAPARGAGAAI